MQTRAEISRWSTRLLQWHGKNGRTDLPWQQHTDPYLIWVSEIMLQQTRVNTVIPYYKSFISRFPNVVSLGESPLDEVLHHWSGLGYYARARNLHRAAVIISSEYRGVFPSDLESVMALPGVGRSTAGAVLALAFGQRHPILDGNVKRVLARYHGIAGWPGQKAVQERLWKLADIYTPARQTARYTQAIMDLGATVCTRDTPDCNQCPFETGCLARQQGRQQDFPGRKPVRILPIKNTVFVIIENEQDEVLLEQRPPSGIWGGLWCFPECEPHTDVPSWVRNNLGYRVGHARQKPVMRHTFSHFHLDILPVLVRVQGEDNRIRESVPRCWYRGDAGRALGLPAPVMKLLENCYQIMEEVNEQNSALCKTG